MPDMIKHNRNDLLRGMCEQIHDFNRQRKHGLDIVYKKLRELNVYSFRAWMHHDYILEDYKTIDRSGADYFHNIYASLHKCGILHITVMSHYWFLDDPAARGKTCMAAPERDMKKGSKYLKFLDMFEKSWETIALEFPYIKYWEIGNELNHDTFLYPVKRLYDKKSALFTHEEKISIMTDMMFRAYRGIKSAIPCSVVVMPGLAPAMALETGYINTSLEYIYKNIESGEYGSKNPDDFFDILCWHPYCPYNMPAQEWKKYNDDIYKTVILHNDARSFNEGKKVYLTEFGFSDFGNEDIDSYLASAAIEKYRLVRSDMPYIDIIHAFRLFDDYAAYHWGGNNEKYFGFYRDVVQGCKIKERGKALLEYYNEK